MLEKKTQTRDTKKITRMKSEVSSVTSFGIVLLFLSGCASVRAGDPVVVDGDQPDNARGLGVGLQGQGQGQVLNPARTNNTVIIVSVGLVRGSDVVFHPCGLPCIEATMWGDVARVFSASSGGKFGFAPPPVSAIVQVALPPSFLLLSHCAIADAWFHAAWALVPNITLYTVRVFLYDPSAGGGDCTAGGFSNHGCTATNCNSWLRGFTTNLVVHELGHLLGFSHAAWDVNVDGVVTNQESTADGSDPMTSDGTIRTFAAPNRLWAGWAACSPTPFPPAVVSPVLLAPLSLGVSGAAALGAPLLWCRGLPNNQRLIVSGRSPRGGDAMLDKVWAPALYVHRQNLQTGEGVCLGLALMNQTLTVGTALTATLVGLTPDGGMRVSFGKCQRNGPRLSASAILVSPTLTNVSVTFVNMDQRCPPRSGLVVHDVSGALSAACKTITISVTKDNSPAEISFWAVLPTSGVYLLPPTNFTSTSPTQTTSLQVCGNTVVDVVFSDSYGDGYCCDWGPGGYSVSVNGLVLQKGGKFTFNETVRVPGAPQWTLPSVVHPGKSISSCQVVTVSSLKSLVPVILAVDSLP